MVDLNARCPTGIPGFDELIEGGFPRKRSILLSGTCGSGKTTFAIQFLYNGIVKYNEPGILISLEQDPQELKADMKNFGFDLDKCEKDGKLAIIDASLARAGMSVDSVFTQGSFKDTSQGSVSLLADEFNMENILEMATSKAKKMGAKRVVLDSLPALDFLLTGEGNEVKIRQMLRQMLISVNYKLKAAGLTTMMITELSEGGESSVHGVESYVVDGAINMYYTAMGLQSGRNLLIKKMRGTEHSGDVHPLAFKKGTGIEVMKPPEPEGL
jgi:KaiC/GvpD/RAD55 family RecA-like ATPase